MSTYELVDEGAFWACVRDGGEVFNRYDRNQDPELPGPYGILTIYTDLVEARWGRKPQWARTDRGWRAE